MNQQELLAMMRRIGGAISTEELAYKFQTKPSRVLPVLQRLVEAEKVRPAYWEVLPEKTGPQCQKCGRHYQNLRRGRPRKYCGKCAPFRPTNPPR